MALDADRPSFSEVGQETKPSALGRRLALLARQRARPYVHLMRTRVNVAIDIRLADLMVALARRRWPALRIVPQRWIRPVLVPAAGRLRRGIAAAALIATAAAGVIIALLAMPS
jgi:hypothetical protein